MKAREVMSEQVRTCAQSGSLQDAAKIMREADCGIVPIVAADNGRAPLVGVITDRDICAAACESGKTLPELALGDYMSPAPHTCTPEATIEDAEDVMRAAQVRRLPVVDAAGELVGMLSLADIAREAEGQRMQANPSISKAAVGSLLGSIVKSRAHPSA